MKAGVPSGDTVAMLSGPWAGRTAGGENAPVFVLSSRLIPGCNCIVIGNSFADLVEALRREGGVRVTVS